MVQMEVWAVKVDASGDMTAGVVFSGGIDDRRGRCTSCSGLLPKFILRRSQRKRLHGW